MSWNRASVVLMFSGKLCEANQEYKIFELRPEHGPATLLPVTHVLLPAV
jgi:hypothetical protein